MCYQSLVAHNPKISTFLWDELGGMLAMAAVPFHCLIRRRTIKLVIFTSVLFSVYCTHTHIMPRRVEKEDTIGYLKRRLKYLARYPIENSLNFLELIQILKLHFWAQLSYGKMQRAEVSCWIYFRSQKENV